MSMHFLQVATKVLLVALAIGSLALWIGDRNGRLATRGQENMRRLHGQFDPKTVQAKTSVSKEECSRSLPSALVTINPAKIEEICQKVLNVTARTFPQRYSLGNLPLKCIQMARSIQTWEPNAILSIQQRDRTPWSNAIKVHRRLASQNGAVQPGLQASLYHLATKLNDSRNRTIKIVVLGGSMTAGHGLKATIDDAWPARLEKMLQTDQVGASAEFQVINIAVGGVQERYWLGQIFAIKKYAPDIVLVESAVNDQCDFVNSEKMAKEVNVSSHILLNQLSHLPSSPAVVSVELFRTAARSMYDANRHCEGHILRPFHQSDHFYCPQWWYPQDWRKPAVQFNNIPVVSYRDAVWPILDRPPMNLNEFWGGLSHPNEAIHHIVAAIVYFAFNVAMQDSFQSAFLNNLGADCQKTALEYQPPLLESNETCISAIFHYEPALSGSRDIRSQLRKIEASAPMRGTSWHYRSDVLNRYGWLYQGQKSQESINDGSSTFRLKIQLGGRGMIMITRLVSYDERMATAKLWFSDVDNLARNALEGSPTWNITSWHKESTSIPVTEVIHVPAVFNKRVDVQLNLAVIPGTSKITSAYDKFKLLGIVAC